MHTVPQIQVHAGRRVSPAIYRRRRVTVVLVLAVAVAALAALLDSAAGGSVGRTVFERVVAVAVAATWLRCAIALWRWNRPDDVSSGSSVAESGASCLVPDSAPAVAPWRAA